MKAPTPKRNEQMSIAHKKYFANFIKSGASYKSFAFEYLRIFKNLLVGVPIIESRKTLTLYLATVKNQYYSWLMKETVARGPENINLEMAVISMANLFNSMDVRSINHGFKKTGLSLFQSEPTIEVELTREEQILNLCERFDKFACSDSEGDE